MVIVEISEKAIDRPDGKVTEQTRLIQRMNQNLTAKCPLTTVGNDFEVLKSSLGKKRPEAVFGKPKIVVRLFVKVPVQRPRQDDYPPRAQQTESFSQERLVVGDVFNNLGAKHCIKTL